MAVGLTMGAPAQAAADSAGGGHTTLSSAQQKQLQEMNAVSKRFMQDREELMRIREATEKKHPQLVQQQQAFVKIYMAELARKIHDPKAEQTALRAMQTKLKSGKLKGKERDALMEKFRKRYVTFRDAELAALRDPKVSAARDKLKSVVIAAMRKDDPKTGGLLKDLELQQQKLDAIRKSMMQNRGK